MFSENNFTSDIAKGATEAIINVSKEEIKSLIYKWENKELLFLGKKETIDLVKRERKTEEWALFDKYIKNKELRILVQMGLALRELEDNPKEIKRIQEIILSIYKGRGLHIAHFVQTGFLKNYIGHILSKYLSNKALGEELENTLRNVEKYIVFIRSSDDVEKTMNILKNRIEVNLPNVLIIYSLKTAVEIAKKIKEKLKEKLEHYKIDDMTLRENRYICFFLRDDDYYREDMGYFK